MSDEYIKKHSTKTCPYKSDAQIAEQVRMLFRDQLNHESICSMARDRICYLSHQLSVSQKIIEDLQSQLSK